MTRKGFTLVELLVVVAIIALLLGILLPALGRAREIANRAACAANVRSVLQGMMIYSQTNQDAFPKAGSAATTGTAWGFQTPTSAGATATTGAVNDSSRTSGGMLGNNVSACLWILVKDGSANIRNFICPSSGNKSDDFKRGTTTYGLNQLWDFGAAANLSFSPINPYHGDLGKQWSASAQSDWIILGDNNNNSNTGTVDPGPRNTRHSTSKGQAAPSPTISQIQGLENSSNHTGSEGQNLGRPDGSTSFYQDPYQGPSNDNVYANDTNVSPAGLGTSESASPTRMLLNSTNIAGVVVGSPARNVILLPVTGNDGENLDTVGNKQ